MLTRAGVARRLGKSIATVRRMEGVELHPEVDDRGVHWFDIREVDTLRRGATNDERRQFDEKRLVKPVSRAPCVELARFVPKERTTSQEVKPERRLVLAAAAEARLAAQQVRIDLNELAEERRRLGHERELAVDHQLEEAKLALIAELEDCPDRILRRLPLEYVSSLLEILEQ
jgi:hypothetical protein